MTNKRIPDYINKADYNTNSPSYYDDLARKQKLIQLLAEKIWEYDERLDQRINDLEEVLSDYLSQWDERIENLDDEVSHIFVTWLNDGTLEQIINHDVLGNKADQSELEKTESMAFGSKSRMKTTKAVVVFTDDDGHNDVLTKLKPIFDRNGIKGTLGIIPDRVENLSDFMNWDEVTQLEDEGWEIASHTTSHRYLSTLNEEEQRFEIFDSKRILREKGFNVNHMIYPYGDNNLLTRQLCSEAGYESGTRVVTGVNTTPTSRYILNRVSLGSFFDSVDGADTSSLEYYKSRVDEAIENDGLLIFCTHIWSEDMNGIQLDYLEQVIQYIQSKGVPIMNMSEAWRNFESVLEVGDPMLPALVPGEEGTYYTQISADGKFNAFNVPTNLTRVYADGLMPINDFPSNKVTYQRVHHSKLEGFAETGTVATHNLFSPSISFQILYGTSNKTYRRHWDNSNSKWNEWSEFTIVGGVNPLIVEQTNNRLPSNHTVDDLEDGITYAPNNAAGGGDYPSNKAGVIQALKISGNGWHHELFFEYDSSNIWTRGTNPDGSFKPFERLVTESQSFDFPINVATVSAQETKILDTNRTADTEGSVILNVNSDIASGIVFDPQINAEGQVLIRVTNVTSEPIDVGTLTFKVRIITD